MGLRQRRGRNVQPPRRRHGRHKQPYDTPPSLTHSFHLLPTSQSYYAAARSGVLPFLLLSLRWKTLVITFTLPKKSAWFPSQSFALDGISLPLVPAKLAHSHPRFIVQTHPVL